MSIKEKNKEECDSWLGRASYFLLHADHMTGEVSKDCELKEYVDTKENIGLDELLSIPAAPPQVVSELLFLAIFLQCSCPDGVPVGQYASDGGFEGG